MGVLEPRKARKRMGILAVKSDDKISGYIENYTYIQPQNLVVTVFLNLGQGLRLCNLSCRCLAEIYVMFFTFCLYNILN